MLIKRRHPFHMVDYSPWPFLVSLGIVGVVGGVVIFMWEGKIFNFLLSLVIVGFISIQ